MNRFLKKTRAPGATLDPTRTTDRGTTGAPGGTPDPTRRKAPGATRAGP